MTNALETTQQPKKDGSRKRWFPNKDGVKRGPCAIKGPVSPPLNR
jgi:hypothetical protein